MIKDIYEPFSAYERGKLIPAKRIALPYYDD